LQESHVGKGIARLVRELISGYLGTVQKLFVQNAPDEFVSARRRREACRGTLTDDNAAMADSDKHNV
jgi:hypothetical protein